MTFLERLEKVRAERQWTWRAWEREAGLNERHLSVVLTRARQREDFRPDWSTLRALAAAAGVSTEWLAEGDDAPKPTPRDEARVERDPEPALRPRPGAGPLETAIGLAFDPRAGHRLQVANAVLAALATDEASMHLGTTDGAELLEAARHWLAVAHRLDREGSPITAPAILLRSVGTPRDEDGHWLDDEVAKMADPTIKPGEYRAGLEQLQRELDESRRKK